MTRPLRAYLGLLLALAIALTGHSAGAMRGSGAAAGQMVICTGTGPLVVYTDAEGRPVPPPHICPDCVMQPLDAVAAMPALLLPVQLAASPAARTPEPARPRGSAPRHVHARAPPAAG